jgi:hypothetical protein
VALLFAANGRTVASTQASPGVLPDPVNPRTVAALLHWHTLANLMSLLAPAQLEQLHAHGSVRWSREY